eukprot:TRINITY_DN41271_c0_g1_i1.p1 TRINITY_DN41271_c0_g1~~TRINITY_DN41271_c0_g1_i1.p1  ORF type:complete len:555 (+),score=96.99 TRINITY_DN41271_c0_g1_i1:60-1667(+)
MAPADIHAAALASPEAAELADDTEQAVAIIAVTAAAAGSLGPAAGAAQAGRALMLLHALDCPDEDGDLESTWYDNPTGLQLHFASMPNRAGATVGNSLILLGVALLWGLTAVIWRSFCSPRRTFPEAFGVWRYPGHAYFVAVLFLQPTLEVGLSSVWYDSSPGAQCICAVACALLFCVAVVPPWYVTHRDRWRVRWYLDEEPPPGSSAFVRCKYNWLDRGFFWVLSDPSYVRRYGMLFRDFWPRRRRFMCVEMGIASALAVLDSFRARTIAMCRLRAGLLLAVCLVHAAIVLALRPYHARLNNVASVGATLLQCGVLLLVILRSEDGGDGVLVAASALMLGNVVLNAIKGGMDFIGAIQDCQKSREKGLVQLAQLADESALQLKLEPTERALTPTAAPLQPASPREHGRAYGAGRARRPGTSGDVDALLSPVGRRNTALSTRSSLAASFPAAPPDFAATSARSYSPRARGPAGRGLGAGAVVRTPRRNRLSVPGLERPRAGSSAGLRRTSTATAVSSNSRSPRRQATRQVSLLLE